MKRLIDEYSLTYSGIEKVEHAYFYAVHGADDSTRHGYLQKAYLLGETIRPVETSLEAN